MPVCFQLTRKSDVASGPVKLNDIDAEMCLHFNAPCDEVKYHAGWYDCVGFRVAVGKTFEHIREEFRGYVEEGGQHAPYYQHMLEVVDWLDENFVTDSWREIGKR